MHIEDLGLVDYKTAWELQTTLFNRNVQLKLEAKEVSETIFFCEHLPVYTLGKSGKQDNLLVSEDALKQKGATLFKVDRGGDITFHGPGQIVVYPILDIEKRKLGIKQYVNVLEQIIIDLLADYSITAERNLGATGVWLNDTKGLRKICAIGIRCSRGITMHGLALNVNTDLSYFDMINPCGFIDTSVTSISQELAKVVELEKIKKGLVALFQKEFIHSIY